MHTRIKLSIVSLSAALLITLATGSSAARNLSISHGELWRAIFNPIEFRSSGLTAAACTVTLEGSFHAVTAPKVERSLVGSITRATVGICRSGSVTVLQETLPWHIQYSGFLGRLPDITGVRLIGIGVSYRVRDAIFGSVCLSRTTAEEPAAVIAELEAGEGNRNVIGVKADSGPRILCGSLNGQFSGTASVVEPTRGERLLVRLI